MIYTYIANLNVQKNQLIVKSTHTLSTTYSAIMQQGKILVNQPPFTNILPANTFQIYQTYPLPILGDELSTNISPHHVLHYTVYQCNACV